MVPILSRKRLVLAAGLSIVLTSVVLSRLPTQPELRHSLQPTAGAPSGWALPSCVPPREYEERLFDFWNSRAYEKLGWLRDKWVRDTGPFVDGKSYRTHPAVRVY